MKFLRLLAGVAGLVLLAGCSMDVGSTFGFGGSAKPGALVVGDEPNAVKAGALILTQGGSAADAATAMYFTMAATYPQAAGLGGGGVCIVRDIEKGVAEEFSFLPKAAADGGEFAVPGNVRGFADVQHAYGSLPWKKVVALGEGYAGTGFPVSRALRARLDAGIALVRLDASLAREFMDEAGDLKSVGVHVLSPDLASTLAAIREEGPDVFYKGRIAAAIAAYSTQQGGGVSAADLAAYKTERATPRVIQVGGNYVYLPAAGKGVGVYVAALIDAVARGAADGQTLPDLAQKTLAGLNLQNQGTDQGATGFAVTDTAGQTVVCAVTMNGAFGSGRTVHGTGVTMARSPGGDVAPSDIFLAPVIASPSADAPAVLAGAGAGGPGSSAALADLLLRLSRGQSIVTRGELRGGAGKGASSADTVNAIICREQSCTALADPSAYGFGLTVPFDEK